MWVSGVEKDVDHICAERLQGDGRLEDNVFRSSYSQSCQLGSCAIGEGRALVQSERARDRQTGVSRASGGSCQSNRHATCYTIISETFRWVPHLLRRPDVCAQHYLTRKHHFCHIFPLHHQKNVLNYFSWLSNWKKCKNMSDVCQCRMQCHSAREF